MLINHRLNEYCYDMLAQIVIFCGLLALANTGNNFGVTHQPEFGEPLSNLTVSVGRDAIFRCLVVHLGGYRVGWVKADTKAIQAIHDHVITHNPRVSVSHSDHSTWYLHIRAVQEEDRGQYMCQINTDPMKSQLGYLEVVVPPDFVPEETSGDVMVPEGGTVKLTCRARGSPAPHVQWRREDGADITIREPSGVKSRVSTYQGEILKLAKITRSEMGAYLCIASNGVPPSVSKRIRVNVHFHPVIQVPNQLVGAPLGTDVTLECYVESSPKSINYWVKDSSGELIIPSDKYEMEIHQKSMFEARMSMSVKKIGNDDVGSYTCVAKNSLGDVESKIRLYEIPGPNRNSASNRANEGSNGRRTDDEDYAEENSEDDDDERGNKSTDEDSNKIAEKPNKWTSSGSSNSVVGPGVRDNLSKISSESGQIQLSSSANSDVLSSNVILILMKFVIFSIFVSHRNCV